jgi:hypothetical protein
MAMGLNPFSEIKPEIIQKSWENDAIHDIMDYIRVMVFLD